MRNDETKKEDELDQAELETAPTEPPPKKRRGFAVMAPERHREIASAGGRATLERGKLHRFTSEEARAAGRKGGVAPHVSRGRRRREVAS